MADRHSHRCKDCGTVWTHERATDVSEEEYRKLHLCPDCGREQRTIHFATKAEEEQWDRRRIAEMPPFMRELLTFLRSREDDEEEEHEQVN